MTQVDKEIIQTQTKKDEYSEGVGGMTRLPSLYHNIVIFAQKKKKKRKRKIVCVNGFKLINNFHQINYMTW